MDYTLILKAAEFAAAAHRDQRRKDPDASPYINHPINVARLVTEVGKVDDAEIIAAALLHDTIEDTKTTADTLRAAFGEDILELVLEVTDDKSLDKPVRKQLQIDNATNLSERAALIRLADKIANVIDITNRPPKSWDIARRREYFDWTEKVVNNCPKVNDLLELTYRAALEEGRHALKNQENGSGGE